MNQDSREESVTGKALKIVGGVTVGAGAAYGTHKGMNSQRATDYLSKASAKEGGPGAVAKGITKYREKVNPMVENAKGFFKTKPSPAGDGQGIENLRNSQMDIGRRMHGIDPQPANPVGPTIKNAENLPNAGVGPTIKNAESIKPNTKPNTNPNTTPNTGQGPTLASAERLSGDSGRRVGPTVEAAADMNNIKQGTDIRKVTGSSAMVNTGYSNAAGHMNYADDTQRAILKSSRRAGSNTVGRSARGVKRAIQTAMKL